MNPVSWCLRQNGFILRPHLHCANERKSCYHVYLRDHVKSLLLIDCNSSHFATAIYVQSIQQPTSALLQNYSNQSTNQAQKGGKNLPHLKKMHVCCHSEKKISVSFCTGNKYKYFTKHS